MSESSLPPKRPYLLRAMHQWMTDGGQTPHVIVDVDRHAVDVPRGFVKDGKIVLNISYDATERLNIGNDWLELDTRFGGAIHHVRAPIGAVLGIYARETGEGMVFNDGDPEPPPPGTPPQGPLQPPAEGGARPAGKGKRAKLTVVK